MTKEVKRIERGWPGHFICAHRCRFRRNTLLELKSLRLIVSTVGCMEDPLNPDKFFEIGFNRHYETMVFFASWQEGKYWDADCQRGEVSFDSPWMVKDLENDNLANNQHEEVVKEIQTRMLQGDSFK